MRYIKSVVVALVFVLFSTSSCGNYSDSPNFNNGKVEKELKSELGLIPIMPNAKEESRDFFKKTGSALITSYCITKNDYKSINDYYSVKLKDNGWQFDKEKKVFYWGKDLGGKEISYKKGDYVATLQYAGDKADYGWTYSFTISWSQNH